MAEETTVQLRVQVIDIGARVLDLQVPTYLPARDLTVRLARDAGLEAWWPGNKRRRFWLRARGRLVREEERLADLGVVNGELIYFLPEPQDGTVVEQVPEMPIVRVHAAASVPVLLGWVGVSLAWSVVWGMALCASRSILVVTLPGFALGLLCASVARHAWGGRPDRLRIAVTALGLALPLSFIALLIPVAVALGGFLTVWADGVPGIILAMMGTLVGWVAWWGPVEALPPTPIGAAAAGASALPACGICGLPVESAVLRPCPKACGLVFHQGCHRARLQVYRGPAESCAVCGPR